jgi:hypothetical protein
MSLLPRTTLHSDSEQFYPTPAYRPLIILYLKEDSVVPPPPQKAWEKKIYLYFLRPKSAHSITVCMYF